MAAGENVRPALDGPSDFDRTGHNHGQHSAPEDSASHLSSGEFDRDYVDDEPEIRTSTERRQHDYETLTGEEEAERLLLGGSEAAPGKKSKNKSSSQRKKGLLSRRPRRSNGTDDEGELLFKAEKGGRSSSEDSSDSNSRRSNVNPLKTISARGKVSSLEVDDSIRLHLLTPKFSRNEGAAARSRWP
jgi:hypothetical protein